MGAIGGLLGTAGGVNGTGIKGPQGGEIVNGTNTNQVDMAYSDAQRGIGEQAELLKALKGQGGIGNQNQVYGQGQNLYGQLSGLNGAGNIGQAISGQQSLAGQYQNIANGVGPNPALAALNNATRQNIANQGAMMAGQRGANANVGLLARQVAQNGAGIQQQAVGQAAELQAQQQLNALQGISGVNQSVAGMGGQLLGAQQAQHNALAGQAAGQVANQMAGTTGFSQGVQGEQGQVYGALANQNSVHTGMQGNINSANAGMANTMMGGLSSVLGGGAQGAAAGAASTGGGAAAAAAYGGQIEKMAAGGVVGPSSAFGQFLSGWGGGAQPVVGSLSSDFTNMAAPSSGNEDLKRGSTSLGKSLYDMATRPDKAKNGNYVGQDASRVPANTMMSAHGGLASSGGKVNANGPAQKAEKSGNSYDNDKIPAMLSEHEIVLPREVTLAADPVKAAAEFVANIIAKRGKK